MTLSLRTRCIPLAFSQMSWYDRDDMIVRPLRLRADTSELRQGWIDALRRVTVGNEVRHANLLKQTPPEPGTSVRPYHQWYGRTPLHSL